MGVAGGQITCLIIKEGKAVLVHVQDTAVVGEAKVGLVDTIETGWASLEEAMQDTKAPVIKMLHMGRGGLLISRDLPEDPRWMLLLEWSVLTKAFMLKERFRVFTAVCSKKRCDGAVPHKFTINFQFSVVCFLN